MVPTRWRRPEVAENLHVSPFKKDLSNGSALSRGGGGGVHLDKQSLQWKVSSKHGKLQF